MCLAFSHLLHNPFVGLRAHLCLILRLLKLELRFEDESKNGEGIFSRAKYISTCTALLYKLAFMATW